MPVGHHDGNYFADPETLDRIEGEGRVAFRYAEPVNGSARRIAGVLNDTGNVLGMMPHPERAIARAHGGPAGPRLLEAVLGETGSASCRERVCQYVYISVVAVSLKKQHKLYLNH